MALLIIGLSFGKRRQEPNPVNMKLAHEVELAAQYFDKEKPLIAAQWEIAKQLKLNGYGPAIDIEVTQKDATQKGKERYLDTEDVINSAIKFAEDQGETIDDVVVVANPFLHLSATANLVKSKGLTVRGYKVGKVGFDNSSKQLQWWCKGPLRFITYGIIVKLGDILNRNLHGIGEKE